MTTSNQNSDNRGFFMTDGRLHGETSDTPRTDAVVDLGKDGRLIDAHRIVNLARQLEREAAQLRAALEAITLQYFGGNPKNNLTTLPLVKGVRACTTGLGEEIQKARALLARVQS